jgi:phospholipase A1
MKNKFLFLYSFVLLLYAPVGLIASDANQYFNNKEYVKALPLLKLEAKSGSKQAMYKLGFIYEHGLGTKVDYKASTYWYKKMSQAYSYTIKVVTTDVNSSDSFLTQVQNQFSAVSDKKGAAFAISKVDTKTTETKNLMHSLWEGNFFGLTPFHENYFLPLSVANSRYPRRSESVHPNATLTPLQEKYKNYSATEAEFQISFKKQLSYNFFGWNEFIFVAYTQTVLWQLYEKSSPFREMNYKPEIFLTVPSSDYLDDNYGLKATRYGYLHESNGQDGYRSRSWNRLQVTGLWQWDNLFLASRVWYRIPENQKSDNYYNGNGFELNGSQTDPNQTGDDNPNIENYLGYGDLTFHYLYGKNQISSMFRYNFGVGGTNRGAVELNWSYPFFHSKNMFWYTKFFSGYGESLIDYDRSVTKTSFGFSFSRGLF